MYPNYYEKQIKVIYGLGSDSKKKLMSTWVQLGHSKTCCWPWRWFIIKNQTYIVVSHVLRSIINQPLDNCIIQDVSILNNWRKMAINVFLWRYKGYTEIWIAKVKESDEIQMNSAIKQCICTTQWILCTLIGASWT